jgi:hypothetical protein
MAARHKLRICAVLLFVLRNSLQVFPRCKRTFGVLEGGGLPDTRATKRQRNETHGWVCMFEVRILCLFILDSYNSK